MLEIEKAVYDFVINDSTFISLTGATSSDPRMYAWYPSGDVVFTEGSQEAALVYRHSINARGFWSYPNQLPDFNFFFRVLSIDQTKIGQVAERLIEIFDETYDKIVTTNFLVKKISLTGSFEGQNEGAPTKPVFTRNQTFRFSNVFRRG